jgi:hypothetical protein
MVVAALILLLAILGFGILFLRIHSLPERIAHRGQKWQFEIVAVLCLVSLFTHMHIFWIVGLLLALIDLPDFGKPLNRIAASSERIAGIDSGKDAPNMPFESFARTRDGAQTSDTSPEEGAAITQRGPTGAAAKLEAARLKERSHA